MGDKMVTSKKKTPKVFTFRLPLLINPYYNTLGLNFTLVNKGWSPLKKNWGGGGGREESLSPGAPPPWNPSASSKHTCMITGDTLISTC